MKKAMLVMLMFIFTISCSSGGGQRIPYTGQQFVEWRAQQPGYLSPKLYYLEGNTQIWSVNNSITGYGETYYTFVNNRLTEVDKGYGFSGTASTIIIVD